MLVFSPCFPVQRTDRAGIGIKRQYLLGLTIMYLVYCRLYKTFGTETQMPKPRIWYGAVDKVILSS